MHRALAIVEAMVALLVEDTVQAKVFENGVITLDDKDQELPAIDVSVGADQPTSETGVENLSFIDSLVEIKVVLYAKASTKKELMQELMRLRSASHQIILAGDRTQGLAYVIDTRYGGAAEPDVNTDGSRITGKLETSYSVYYRMSVSTPE
jgi:hypothetical protein